MKRIGLALALCLISSIASAQCTGVFSAGQVCGSIAGGPPKAVPSTGLPPGAIIINGTVISGGTNLRVLYDNSATIGEYTNAQVTALINLATTSLSGALPAWPNNTTTFFRGDGTYATLNCAALTNSSPSCATDATNAANISSGTLPSGRISGSYTGLTGTGALAAGSLAPGFTPITTALIGSSQVTYAKLQNETASTLLGNPTGSGAAPSEVTLGTGLSFVGSVLTNTGQATYVLLNTLTASNSATLSDITSLTATYSTYKIVFQNIIPVTDNTSFELQVHSGGTFQSTSYAAQTSGAEGGGSFTSNTTSTYIPVSYSAASAQKNAAPGLSGEINVYAPSITTAPKIWNGTIIGIISGTTTSYAVQVGGWWNGGNGAVDGFQVLFNTGNISSGVIKIYGIL